MSGIWGRHWGERTKAKVKNDDCIFKILIFEASIQCRNRYGILTFQGWEDEAVSLPLGYEFPEDWAYVLFTFYVPQLLACGLEYSWFTINFEINCGCGWKGWEWW